MHLDVIVAAIVASVVSGLIVSVFVDPLRTARAWCWRKVVVYVRRGHSRYRAWRQARYRRGVEAGLDKVQELVRREDIWSEEVWRWSEELRLLWFQATVELINSEVNWEVVFPRHGVKVCLQDNRGRMRLDRGDIFLESGPNLDRVLGGTSPGAGS